MATARGRRHETCVLFSRFLSALSHCERADSGCVMGGVSGLWTGTWLFSHGNSSDFMLFCFPSLLLVPVPLLSCTLRVE